MGFINQQAFEREFPRNELLREALNNRFYYGNVPVNMQSAREVFDRLREYTMTNGNIGGKDLRPWLADTQFYSSLDRSEVWLGWEFETGFVNRLSRSRVIGHTWDTWDNVTFDSEGEGGAAVEITFAPTEYSKYEDGSAPALQFMEYLDSVRQDGDTDDTGEDMVGTHVNISHPLLTRENMTEMAELLNAALASMPRYMASGVNTRMHYFGRSHLYGGFYARWSEDNESVVWLEGKLFRTTYELAVFRRYLDTAKALVRVLSAALENPDPSPLGRVTPEYSGLFFRRVPSSPSLYKYGRFCTNFMDVLNGADPVLQTGTHGTDWNEPANFVPLTGEYASWAEDEMQKYSRAREVMNLNRRSSFAQRSSENLVIAAQGRNEGFGRAYQLYWVGEPNTTPTNEDIRRVREYAQQRVIEFVNLQDFPESLQEEYRRTQQQPH